MTARAWRLAILAFALASCHRDKDSYIILHNDVNCDVPRVYQLRVTISNSGSVDQKLIPEVASTELGFPSSIVLDLPSSRVGSVDLVVDALDNKYVLIGQATVSGTTITVGGTTDVKVQIAASTSKQTTVSITTTSTGLDGGAGSDAGTASQADATTVSKTSFTSAQVALGAQSTCAVRSDTSLWCWGNNTYGQLRLSGTSSRLTPIEVSGLAWATVACGQTHACGVRTDGTLSCWGNNASGQLGGATTGDTKNQQVDVSDGPWASVATGSYQTCAVKGDTTLWCWGDNTNGQLGSGLTTTTYSTPLQVTGTGWAQASASYLHTCAVKQDGTLWCWGMNANLQLGSTSFGYQETPGQIAGSSWTQVVTGLYHTCGLMSDGTLWCWGGNTAGQLGNTSVTVASDSKTSNAVQVSGAWKSVAAGQSHTCGIMSDLSLWCWGSNAYGQLGDGTLIDRSVPVAVAASGLTWTSVAAGLGHTCALTTDGYLWCWGTNVDGELGVGSTEQHKIPVQVVQ